ncbi:MAG: hypothetical protein FWC68_01825 [Oscillospiraceae bacterium]|nr:hypothetical protein [Oscillospiraceae bacterium]
MKNDILTKKANFTRKKVAMKYAELIEELKKKSEEALERNELYDIYVRVYTNEHNRSFENALSYLKGEHIITELEKNKYILVTKKVYKYTITDEVVRIKNEIQREYPEVDFVAWDTAVINEFTLHYSINNYIVVEVERLGIELIVNLLKEKFLKKYTILTHNILSDNRGLYLNTEKFIVVKPLIQKAPLVGKENKRDITIEKVMVDLYKDRLYLQYQGEELKIIYENIFDKYDINMKKLINYASLRTDIETYKRYIYELSIPNKYKLEG